jgi:uncharacterized membrane protein (UPF0127 family)
MTRILNETKGTVVAEQVGLAHSFWKRFKGLMMRSGLPDGEALLIEPSGSIHTAFMRFPIDVVFLSRDHEVVKVVPAIRPWRLAFSKGHGALELSAGSAARAGVEAGDRLALVGQ